MASIRTFNNVRARFRREKDGTWHAGWVSLLSPEGVRIGLQAYATFERAERVACECYGDGARVRFQARVIAQAGQELAFELEGAFSFERSEETVRVRVGGLSGEIREGERVASFLVMDVSPEALGGVADASFVPGARLSLRVDLGDRPFEAVVSVANCRVEDAAAGHHRIGLRLLEVDRLSAAAWSRLVGEFTGG